MVEAGAAGDAISIDAVSAVVAVLVLSAVTMGTRVGGVWLMSFVRITPRVEIFLKYMSVSVLISIVAPVTWTAAPHIWAGVATATLVMVASRSALAAMLAGTALAAVGRSFGF